MNFKRLVAISILVCFWVPSLCCAKTYDQREVLRDLKE